MLFLLVLDTGRRGGGGKIPAPKATASQTLWCLPSRKKFRLSQFFSSSADDKPTCSEPFCDKPEQSTFASKSSTSSPPVRVSSSKSQKKKRLSQRLNSERLHLELEKPILKVR